VALKSTISHARYDAKSCKRYNFKLNLKTDADVIEKLSQVDSMQGYIKQLIRRDIANGTDVVPVKLSESAAEMLKKKAEEKGISTSELIALAVNEQLVRIC